MKGEEVVKEINAKEEEVKKKPIECLPWDLPEIRNTDYSFMLKDDTLLLSFDRSTFLKTIDGSEDERYSPEKNAPLIVLLRGQDKNLQKVRYEIVQKDGLIDVSLHGSIKCRMIISGETICSAYSNSQIVIWPFAGKNPFQSRRWS